MAKGLEERVAELEAEIKRIEADNQRFKFQWLDRNAYGNYTHETYGRGKSCPHCFVTIGGAYSGTPACRQSYWGEAPKLEGCMLRSGRW